MCSTTLAASAAWASASMMRSALPARSTIPWRGPILVQVFQSSIGFLLLLLVHAYARYCSKVSEQ